MNAGNKDLFTQIRIAHRLVVAYYKRLHQMLSGLGQTLGLDFFVWGPTEYGRPCNRLKNILEYWAWDMAPGVVTEYVFRKVTNHSEQGLGDWMLVLHVISDDAVTSNAIRGDLDPIDLSPSAEDAKSLLRCFLVVPHKNLNQFWYDDIWIRVRSKILCTDNPETQQLDAENGIYGAGFEIQLSELCFENLSLDDVPASLIKKIAVYRDLLLEQQKAGYQT